VSASRKTKNREGNEAAEWRVGEEQPRKRRLKKERGESEKKKKREKKRKKKKKERTGGGEEEEEEEERGLKLFGRQQALAWWAKNNQEREREKTRERVESRE
jgi:hypothetical protein